MQHSNKKILFISPLPPPFGGIATWTNKIIHYGLPGDYIPVIVNTRIRGNRKVFEKTAFSLIEVLRTVVILVSLLFHIVKDRPRVVHLSCSLSPVGIFRDFACALIVKLFRIPLVSHYRGNVTDFPQHKLYGLSYFVLKSLIRLSLINIAENIPSHMLVSKTVDEKHHDPILLPNFIDDDIFQQQAVSSEHDKKRLRIMFAGGITKAKGCVEFIETAKQIKEADFIMIGSIVSDMEAVLEERPPNLILRGQLSSHDDVIKEMCSSDMLLFPSYSEGFPTVVLEAMSVGLPIVATKVGAIPEMVDDNKGGIIVKVGDIVGMVSAVNLLRNDPELRMQMGQYNRIKSHNNYRFSIVSKKLTDIYDMC